SECRILACRLLEECERAAEGVLAPLLEEEAATKIEIVRLEIVCPSRRRRTRERHGRAELGRDGVDDGVRDLVLNLEEVGCLPLEHVRPERRTVSDVDEPRRDTEPPTLAL